MRGRLGKTRGIALAMLCAGGACPSSTATPSGDETTPDVSTGAESTPAEATGDASSEAQPDVPTEVSGPPACTVPPRATACPEQSEPWTPACYDPKKPCDCPKPPDDACIAAYPGKLEGTKVIPVGGALPPGHDWVQTLLWTPAAPGAKTRYLITLHGSSEMAAKELYWWNARVAAAAKCFGVELGILALQYYDEAATDPMAEYLDYNQILAIIDTVLGTEVKAGRAAETGHIFHGFSRGSANMYELAIVDGKDGKRWGTRFIANSGAWHVDQPPPPVADAQKAGDTTALAGVDFFVYYGLQDHDPSQNGKDAQANAAKVVEELGGTAKIVEEPLGCHSTFETGLQSDHAFESLVWALSE